MNKLWVLLAVSLPVLGLAASAQTTSAVTYSPDQLLQIAQQMREQAKSSKDTATGILEKRLDGSTRLAYRYQDGKAEMHQQLEDVFVVLQGTATLISGGTIENPVTSAPAEVRGSAIRDGVRKKLQEGDIVHIPAGVPHQVLLDAGGTFTYFVAKIPAK